MYAHEHTARPIIIIMLIQYKLDVHNTVYKVISYVTEQKKLPKLSIAKREKYNP
jgi:hypothetical protein